jgi:hypothetical protein
MIEKSEGADTMNWTERTTRALPCALNALDQLAFLRAFTHAHEMNADDPCAREAECLQIQFAAQLLPPRDMDFLVGRRTEFVIGFAPERLVSGVGYYLDEAKLDALRADASLSDADRAEIDSLRAYWRGRPPSKRSGRATPRRCGKISPMARWTARRASPSRSTAWRVRRPTRNFSCALGSAA